MNYIIIRVYSSTKKQKTFDLNKIDLFSRKNYFLLTNPQNTRLLTQTMNQTTTQMTNDNDTQNLGDPNSPDGWTAPPGSYDQWALVLGDDDALYDGDVTQDANGNVYVFDRWVCNVNDLTFDQLRSALLAFLAQVVNPDRRNDLTPWFRACLMDNAN